ncbi:MAG: amidohydrolase/deacetylase family metallohydrolase, partial [Thermomicrobiales bacterium]
FDVGHGAGSFDWAVCEKALAQDFEPTTISSDLHAHNVEGPVYDLVTTISKFLMLGMSLEDALAKVTEAPARVAVGQHTGLGTLSPGSEGDAVVLEIEEGDFPFVDSRWVERRGTSRLAVRAVVKAGRTVRTNEH